jgi:hypothetical protein
VAPLFRRARRAVLESPLRSLLALVSVATALYVVIAPLWSAYYPPITDLPCHAAQASIFRHYWDPSWHFREQFVLQPIAVPYVLHYAVGALLMCFLPTVTAMKAATAILLLMMPAGIALLLHGMKRSPMGALFSLPFTYCSLSHWGFINFVAALGVFAAAVGLAMLTVERPTPGRRVALALALVVLFFTHIFRFPMGVAAVIGTAIFLYPVTRRLRPVVLPVLPSLALFVIWFFVRPATLAMDDLVLRPDPERRKEIAGLIFDGFADPAEGEILRVFLRVAVLVAIAATLARIVERRAEVQPARAWDLAAASWLVVVSCALVFLGLFFSLPMQIGLWWYVYPREVTSAAFIATAALPALPRSPAVRAPLVLALALAAVGYGRYVSQKYAEFDAQTADFRQITQQLPQAPRLLYLIYDHRGSPRTVTPFVHLPAWIQAERGGHISFNFANLGGMPIAYRSPDDPIAVLGPRMPLRWEWNAYPFKVLEHGAFFDWFLVRSAGSPDAYFEDDPDIERVDHVRGWWLCRRVPPSSLGRGLR